MKRQINRHLFVFVVVILIMGVPLTGQEMCFPPHEGLPNHGQLPPTPDGFVERSVGFPVELLEQGYVRSSYVTYGGGSSIPVASFRGVARNDGKYLYLGFTVEFDPSWDNDDVIVIVLRPNMATTHTADERRIDIYPLCDTTGAASASGGGGCGDPNDVDPNWVAGQNLRRNRPPRNVEYSKWDMSGAYVPLSAPPSNTTIKVRSWGNGMAANNWSVEVQLPTTAGTGADQGGSEWVTLASHFRLYYDIIRVCTGAACTVPVETNFTTQFPSPQTGTNTGILSGLNIPLASLEIPPGYLGEAVIGSAPTDCHGVRFDNTQMAIGVKTATSSTSPLTTWINGTALNEFAARIVNDGSGTSAPVSAEVRIANWGLASPTPAGWDKIPARTTPPHSPGNSNPSPALPVTGTATPTELIVQWQLDATERAAYTGREHQCIWVLLNSAGSVNFSESSRRQNMDFTGLSSHHDVATISGVGYPDTPQGGNHDFLLTVHQRFLTPAPLGGPSIDSKMVAPPTPNARVRYPEGPVVAPPTPNAHVRYPEGHTVGVVAFPEDEEDAVLLTEPEYTVLKLAAEHGGKGPVTSWLWFVNGYRRTPETLTIGQNTYQNYQHVGAFGESAYHVGPVDEFRWQISGSGLQSLSPSTFRLPVPDGGSAKLNTFLEAVDPTEQSSTSRHRFFFDIGTNFPNSGFASFVEGNWSANVGVERMLQPNLSVEAIAGHHSFDGDSDFDNEERFHFCLNIEQFSVNMRRYVGAGPLHVSMNGGVGAYYLDPPESWKWGANAGMGVLYDINSRWGLEGAFNYHRVNSNPDLGWSTLQAGLRISF